MTNKTERQKKKEVKQYLLLLSFSSLGVVFGDIGTSPLYALRECFYGKHAVSPRVDNILGVLSLIFWSLMLVISVKYLILILRADNQGEGGILALMQLVLPEKNRNKTAILLLGLFGAALLYGDGTITPAISVLSAVEGLKVATPVFKPFILPITLVILFFLFLVQRHGSGKVGMMFGTVMLVWFAVIAATGAMHILKNVDVLAAAFFLIIDISFFGANLLKIWKGGWYPLLLAGGVYFFMATWFNGRKIVGRQLKEYLQPLKRFVKNMDLRKVTRVSGTAIYLTQNPLTTPPAFMQNISRNKIIHSRIIFLSVGFKGVPHVPARERIRFEKLRDGFYRVLVRYGFLDAADLHAVIRILNNRHLKIDMEQTTIFVRRGTLIPSQFIGMSTWRDKLYILMAKNSAKATTYFNLPPDHVLEIGGQIKL